MDIVFLWMYW